MQLGSCAFYCNIIFGKSLAFTDLLRLQPRLTCDTWRHFLTAINFVTTDCVLFKLIILQVSRKFGW